MAGIENPGAPRENEVEEDIHQGDLRQLQLAMKSMLADSFYIMISFFMLDWLSINSPRSANRALQSASRRDDDFKLLGVTKRYET